MIAPPRTAELLLHALGAAPDFRDDVLGDLAEEFALRAAWDGPRSARRWYWREAGRVAPHLLRDWARQLSAPDAARVAGVVLGTWVLLSVDAALLILAGRGAMAAFGVDAEAPLLSGSLLPVIALALGVVAATAGGAIAASLDRKTPLVSALALGVFWACLGAVVQTLAGPAPAWYRVGAPLVVVLGTAIGGALRVRIAGRLHGTPSGA